MIKFHFSNAHFPKITNLVIARVINIQNCLYLKPMIFSLHYPLNTDRSRKAGG